MARLAFAHVDQAPEPKPHETGRLVDQAECAAAGEVASRPVIHGADRPVWLWQHRLAPGARLEWPGPAADHALYVQGGSLDVDGAGVESGAAVIVEHGARVTVAAGAAGATILQFHRAPGPTPAERAGGRVHVLGPRGAFQRDMPGQPETARYTCFADSTCETCAVSLHKSEFVRPQKVGVHRHSADEILFITRGAMRVGRRSLPAGRALAIDKGVQYGFAAGEAGLHFLTFRPAPSDTVWIDEAHALR